MPSLDTDRALSVDVFRGLTVLAMIFVNDLGTAGIPRWMQHATATENRMTFVDVVFPAFLFIVGMSLPLALRARAKRGEPPHRVHLHAVVRTMGLLVMGFFLVNGERFNAEVAALDYFTWTLGAHLAIVLVWTNWPKKTGAQKARARALQGTGWAAFAFLFWAFCAGDFEHPMVRSWWGILGLVGWAYFIAYVCLQLTGKSGVLLAFCILLFAGFRTGESMPSFSLPGGLGFLREFAGIGILASMTLVGSLVAERFLGEGAEKPEGRFRWLLTLAAILFLAGAAFRPHLGASKIQATPTWGLYSAGYCCLLFGGLFYLLDVKRWRNWSRFVLPAGTNPLLLYLLPGIVYCLLGILGVTFLHDHFGSGGLRILRSAVMALLLLGMTAWLTKRGLVMKL